MKHKKSLRMINFIPKWLDRRTEEYKREITIRNFHKRIDEARQKHKPIKHIEQELKQYTQAALGAQ